MQPAKNPAILVASGGTTLAGLLFLGVALGSLLVNNGVFSAGIGVMLALYGALLLFIAWGAWRRNRWANGAMVASSLLHILVAGSTARGSHQPWLWAVVLLAVVTLVAALRVHLSDLRSTPN